MRHLINRWRWRRTRKQRVQFFERAYEMGFVAGDPEYWRQDKAAPSEWLHLMNHVEGKMKE